MKKKALSPGLYQKSSWEQSENIPSFTLRTEVFPSPFQFWATGLCTLILRPWQFFQRLYISLFPTPQFPFCIWDTYSLDKPIRKYFAQAAVCIHGFIVIPTSPNSQLPSFCQVFQISPTQCRLLPSTSHGCRFADVWVNPYMLKGGPIIYFYGIKYLYYLYKEANGTCDTEVLCRKFHVFIPYILLKYTVNLFTLWNWVLIYSYSKI